MPSPAKRKAPRIIAIGGGKGGVGKSTVAANLALAIGRSGHRVALVDADLGAANLHTALGVMHPTRCLADYIDQTVDSLDDVMMQITPTVHLIAGMSRPGSASLAAAQKLRLLRAICKLEVECVIVDVGAGTSYTVVDLLAAADHKLLVVCPQLTSLHNAYALMKACVHRVVRKQASDETQRDLIDAALGHETKARTIPQLLGVLRPLDARMADAVTDTLSRFGVGLIGNQLNNTTEADALRRMTPLIRDHLMIAAPVLAAIRRTQALAGGLIAGKGTIASRVADDNTYLAFRQLAETLLSTDLAHLRGEERTSQGKTMPLWIQRGLEAEVAAGQVARAEPEPEPELRAGWPRFG